MRLLICCGDVEVSEKPHSGDISHNSERGRTYAAPETKLSDRTAEKRAATLLYVRLSEAGGNFSP